MAESTMEGILTPSASQRPKRRARLNAKRKLTTSTEEDEIKRRRTFDSFYKFCNFVLEYEEKLASESMTAVRPPSPVNSAGESSASSTPSSSDTSSNGSDASDGAEGEGEIMGPGPISGIIEEGKLEYTSDDESWNLVTCFCRRPFAGRPMIECSKCKTWIHLFCARVKKDHVPDVYICPSCRPKAS